MISKNRYLFAWLCLQLPVVGYAGTLGPASAEGTEGHASPCAKTTPSVHRTVKPQGTMLWGTRRGCGGKKDRGERERARLGRARVPPTGGGSGKDPAARGRAAGGPFRVVRSVKGDALSGTVLQGLASDGSQVEVAICGAEPSVTDPSLVQYNIQVWNTLAQQWENPCVALSSPTPLALAVSGVWDASGAHHDSPDRFTFACENGVITKCIHFGYKPWDSRDGRSLADVHQACTRMARADYCGDGHTHTHNGTLFDYYDRFGLVGRTTESSDEWDLKRASFEAAWAPDGATSLAHTRDGSPLDSVLQECPGRFHTGPSALDLGGGDRAQVWRTDMNPADSVLRDWSYGTPNAARVLARHP